MTAKVAVAVIHGIASQAQKRPAVSTERSFSDALYKKLRRRLGRRMMEQDIAWREIFWSDVLAARQEEYLDRISGMVSYDRIRKFLVQGIADAAAFQPGENTVAGSAYNLVIERVRKTIADLNGDTSDDTPLIILAHSFGGHIISSYIWDMQHGRISVPTPFQRMESIARFITFGSNLPLFTFACPLGEVHPIAYPGPALPEGEKREPWWLNYYDRHDVLGYPLGPIGERYQEMVDRGELVDIQINSGGLLSSWNPLSHESYWTDRDFYRPVADILKGIISRTSQGA